MRLITQRELIEQVVRKWAAQYPDRNARMWNEVTPGKVLEKLQLLDLKTCDAESVDEIIGNSSWTALRCHECGSYVAQVVECGEPPDYESSTVRLCRDCAQLVATQFDGTAQEAAASGTAK